MNTYLSVILPTALVGLSAFGEQAIQQPQRSSKQPCDSAVTKVAKRVHVRRLPKFVYTGINKVGDKTGIDVGTTIGQTVSDAQTPHPCPVAKPPAPPAPQQQ
jgi:hypothetical protein